MTRSLYLLLALLLCLLCCGCTASLGEAKSAAMARKYGSKPTEIPSRECRDLDSAHRRWGNAAKWLGYGAPVVAGGIAAVPENTPHRTEVQIGMGVGAGLLGGAAAFALEQSDAAKKEWVELCVIQ